MSKNAGSLEYKKRLYLRDARESLQSAQTLLSRIEEMPLAEDAQAISNAANQATQAARDLNTLVGFLTANGAR